MMMMMRTEQGRETLGRLILAERKHKRTLSACMTTPTRPGELFTVVFVLMIRPRALVGLNEQLLGT